MEEERLNIGSAPSGVGPGAGLGASPGPSASGGVGGGTHPDSGEAPAGGAAGDGGPAGPERGGGCLRFSFGLAVVVGGIVWALVELWLALGELFGS